MRELENVLAGARLLARGGRIDSEHLELPSTAAAVGTGDSLRLEAMEREHLQRVLVANAWNRSDAARALGIDRGTLQRKIARYGLSPERP